MKDFIIAFLGAVVIGLLVSKENIIENWGNLPKFDVQVQKTIELECENEGENKYKGPIVAVPPNYQNMLAPRAAGVNYGANILYNMPDISMQGIPADPLSQTPLGPVYGGSRPLGGAVPVSANMGVPQEQATCPPCNQKSSNVVKEGYEDTYEPISSSASVKAWEKAQKMADNGMIKSEYQPPNMKVETENGPCNVVVYDRLVYANSKSKLYGQGDPIRGDVGCIVPIKDQWFRPSVRPNIDLRAGAMTIMGGIDNETPKELRALQNIYSAGVSEQTTDAYAFTVNPALAQKSISVQGNGGAASDISVSASP